MSAEVEQRVHATAIALHGKGVLLRGPSGSGKSDLALRCLAHRDSVTGSQFRLIADDQVVLTRTPYEIRATVPSALAGLLEVRGIGIIEVEALDTAPIVLFVDLVRDEVIERLPVPLATSEMLGLQIPTIRLRAFEASAPHKVAVALSMSSLPPIGSKP